MFWISELGWTTNEIESIAKHRVTPDEVEEALLGVDGEAARYIVRRDGDYYAFLGETGDGRLLSMVGELLAESKARIFHADDTKDTERVTFRRGR